MSGTFASTIRENRFKIKLACLNMEWENKDNEYIKQSLACVGDGSFVCGSQSKSYSRTKAEPRSKTACNQSLEIFETPLPVLWKGTWRVLRSDVSQQIVTPKVVCDSLFNVFHQCFPAHYLEIILFIGIDWIVELFYYQIKILNFVTCNESLIWSIISKCWLLKHRSRTKAKVHTKGLLASV